MTDWLGSENLRSVAAACQERIDAFYCRVARNEGRDARYFVEKRWPDPLVPRLTAELYPEGREIILVRDFRDMVCSILGFSEKRGLNRSASNVPPMRRSSSPTYDPSVALLRDSWRERRERHCLCATKT